MAVLAALYGLNVAASHAPFQASWVIHFLFVLLLTALVYRWLLDFTHARLYLVGLVVVMIGWEAYEWLGKGFVGSTTLSVVDSFLDTLFGLLGAAVAIKYPRPGLTDIQ